MLSSKHPIYSAFGLNIACTIPLAADHGMIQVSGDTVPDVIIRAGVVQEYSTERSHTCEQPSVPVKKMTINIKGVARYFITGGNEIVVQAEEGADPGDVAIFTFGSAIGTLLHQRGIVAIHGSAVRTADGAVLFTGNQGVGKSTTAAALSKRGWAFMADDICAIHIQDGVPYLYPGLVRAKLTRESYQQVMGSNPTQKPMMPLTEKYSLEFKVHLQPERLRTICLIEKSDIGMVVEPIRGAKRFAILMDNIYRSSLHRRSHDPAYCFDQYAKVSSAVNMVCASRLDGMEHLDGFINTIEEQILKVSSSL